MTVRQIIEYLKCCIGSLARFTDAVNR